MARRGHNEGSIYQRKDGRWVASVSLPDGGRRDLYAATRAEARARLLDAQADLARGLPLPANARQTVAQFLGDWLESIEPTLDFATWCSHRRYVKDHIAPTIGKVRLAALSPQQVQRLYAARLAAGLSGTSVNHLHATLHKALEAALRLGLVARNVTELVDVPRKDTPEIRPLSREEAQAFLASVEGTPREALYVVALSTGLRMSELLGLCRRDLDLAPTPAAPYGVLRVRNQLKRREGVWLLKPPKTRRSRRQIALSAPAARALRRHLARLAEERLTAGALWAEGLGDDFADLVFCTPGGRPLLRGNVWRGFQRALARAGSPRVRFHDLRHTCATLLLAARVNPKVVSELLGHASVAITLDIYSHVLPDMQADAAQAMGEMLSPRAGASAGEAASSSS